MNFLRLGLLAVPMLVATASPAFAEPREPVLKCERVKETQCQATPTGQIHDCKQVIATICTIVAGPGSGKTMSIAPAGGPSAIPPRYRLCSPGLRPGALAPLCPRSRTDR